MFRSLKRSFQLAKESFLVLCQDLELLLLTAASFVGVVIVIALAGGMGFGTGAIDLDAEQLINSNGIGLLILAYAVLFAYANDGTTGGYSKDTLNHAFHSR